MHNKADIIIFSINKIIKWAKTQVPPIAQKDKNLAGIYLPNLVSHNKRRYSQTTSALSLDSPNFLLLKLKDISLYLT